MLEVNFLLHWLPVDAVEPEFLFELIERILRKSNESLMEEEGQEEQAIRKRGKFKSRKMQSILFAKLKNIERIKNLVRRTQNTEFK